MSTGYGANYADVIEEKDFKKVGKCGVLLSNLLSILHTDNCSLEKFAQDIKYESDDVGEELFIKAESIYHALQAEFEKVSRLELWLEYHNSNDVGDCYDQVNGAFWAVNGVTGYTPEYIKFRKKIGIHIERNFFVTYG